jgi:flavin reductase
MTVSPEDFRLTLGHFATGVTVMTTRTDETVHGMTANAFTSVSLDPPLVLVCVQTDAVMHPLVEQSGVFAVNVLTAGQEGLSGWFSLPDRPVGDEQFAGVAWRPAPRTGSPLLAGALAYVDCEVRDVHPGGDHGIFVGEVVDAEVSANEPPLLYYRSAYGTFAQKVPKSRSPKSPRPGTM